MRRVTMAAAAVTAVAMVSAACGGDGGTSGSDTTSSAGSGSTVLADTVVPGSTDGEPFELSPIELGGSSGAAAGSFEQLAGAYPIEQFPAGAVVRYVDLDALSAVAGADRPDRADRAAVRTWTREVFEGRRVNSVLVRGSGVSFEEFWRDEMGFDILDVRQSLMRDGLLAESLSLVRLAVPVASVIDTVRAQPVWGPRYDVVVEGDANFVDSGDGEDVPPVDVTARTDTRPLGYADQLAIGQDDVLVGTIATRTMRDVIGLSGGSLAEQPFVQHALAQTSDHPILQAMVASLPEHLWQTGWTLVAANVRDVNGEASSVVVVGAPSVAEAEAYTRSLGELAVGRLSPVFADASIETVDAATVIRLPDPDLWWSLGQSLTGQGPTLARLGD